jgi:hypothetical protein
MKVYRRILGPAYDNEIENWRMLTNKEIEEIVKIPTITETVSLDDAILGIYKEWNEIDFPKEYQT